jgi:hypothetical protein
MIWHYPSGARRSLSILAPILAVVLWLANHASSWADEGSLGRIRNLADGAGPSHLFWLNGPAAGQPGTDIIGVIDPLYSAIRFFSIIRTGDVSSPLSGRLKDLGACTLDVNFLPWHVHQFKNYVVIEGMPRPGPDGQKAVEKSFKSIVLSIDRTLLAGDRLSIARSARIRIETVDWDPSAGPECGKYSASETRTGDAASYIARRGRPKPKSTIILTNKANALAPKFPLTVHVRTGGQYWLYSATELEPAGSVRIVQTSQGAPGNDGMVRITQRLLIFGGRGSKPRREMLFDESRARSKLGYKALAVLPSGELLAMGRFGASTNFSIRSCGNVLLLEGATEVCREMQREAEARKNLNSEDYITGAENGPSANVDAGRLGSSVRDVNEMFSRLRPYVTKSWSVDASRLPEQCRLPSGCEVPGQEAKFVPLRGIRLSRKTFTRTGAPYAQTDDLRDVRKFLETSDRDLTLALERVTNGAHGAPGNLNDDYDGEIGIDCSALVQIAWSGADSNVRLSTDVLQARTNLSYRCDNRVRDASAMKSGDAIGLNVKPGISHAVLYAAELKFDGANTSWLVLESSSSCDGVCWSVYDPAFFNGWGIYRAAGRRDLGCPAPAKATSIRSSPIPLTASAWRAMLNRSLSEEP